MNNIKLSLNFLSFRVKDFLVFIICWGGFFAFLQVGLIASFFLGFRLSLYPWLPLGVIAFFVLFYQLLLRKFFMSRKIRLVRHLAGYVMAKEKADFSPMSSGDFKAARKAWQKYSANRSISGVLLFVLAAVAEPGTWEPDTDEKILGGLRAEGRINRLLAVGWGAVLFVPFGAMALLFTLGDPLQLKVFITVMAVSFVLFLQFALISPIMLLDFAAKTVQTLEKKR